MLKRWLMYLAVLCGCLIFYMAYQQWFAWLTMVGILSLPWLSLLLSLPGMLRMRLTLECPQWVEQGAEAQVCVRSNSRLPGMPYRCPVEVTRMTTGERWRLSSGAKLPAEHCGALLCKLNKGRVYDLLGLFFLPAGKEESCTVLVRPKPCRIKNLQALERHMACAWRPKAGGGFAENHELRLYRPGDNLNQIHWKLSAKTGKIMIREAMVPDGAKAMITLDLRGSPEELDRKLGRLAWLSTDLANRGLAHEICAFTGSGLQHFPVVTVEDTQKAVDVLLSCASAPEDMVLKLHGKASWHCHIGGEPDGT